MIKERRTVLGALKQTWLVEPQTEFRSKRCSENNPTLIHVASGLAEVEQEREQWRMRTSAK